MLRSSKAIKIRVLWGNLVEIHYYDVSKRLQTLNFREFFSFSMEDELSEKSRVYRPTWWKSIYKYFVTMV